MTGPLAGTRVLEFPAGVGGAMAGGLLAAAGAEVTLVEPPVRGCDVRWLAPFFDDVPGAERGGIHLFTGRGKRSLTLDTSAAEGQALLGRLMGSADLVIHDGTLETSADEAAPDTGPHAIAIRPFSPQGPYAGYEATELQLAALGGWLAQVGDAERGPVAAVTTTMTGFVPGFFAATLATAVLAGTTPPGRPLRIDVSGHEATVAVTRYLESTYSYTGWNIRQMGATFGPLWGVFPAADGYVALAAATDQQAAALLDEAGIDATGFQTWDERFARAEELRSQVSAWSERASKSELFHRLQAKRIPAAAVSTPAELVHNEHLRARELFEEIDHPVVGVRPYPRLPGGRGGQATSTGRRRAPLLGEDTAAVLGELGEDADAIRALAAAGVI